LRRPGGPEGARPAPESRPEPAFDLPATEPTPTAPEIPRADVAGAKSKSVLDSLEEEMASLLGRPPEKP
jgi:hypothetical protein